MSKGRELTKYERHIMELNKQHREVLKSDKDNPENAFEKAFEGMNEYISDAKESNNTAMSEEEFMGAFKKAIEDADTHN